MLSHEIIWWITAFELPVFGGMFWLIWRNRKESRDDSRRLNSALEKRTAQLREALGAYKLEVVKTYAARSDVRELESRLISHLLRIEAKLDSTALKTEALKAKDPTSKP